MVEIDLMCYAIKKNLHPADSLVCLYLYKYVYVIPPAKNYRNWRLLRNISKP